MSLKDRCGEKVHTRSVEISTYDCGEEGIIVEGVLKDNRLKPYYLISGEAHPPGTIHHMVIRLLIGEHLLINKIEVEMPCTPHEDCIETINSLKKTEGLNIAPGFSAKVKKITGGTKGCSHLTTLLLVMAPAAVQGFWTNLARKPLNGQFSRDSMEKYLIDTCYTWRKNGPLMKKLENTAGSDEIGA
ncbi:MAG: DUF2889 domain-containing protein [Pseudomonadota bacterium]|nr:DUF2889 domain-containing protein [Pseudomonadota bacterium]